MCNRIYEGWHSVKRFVSHSSFHPFHRATPAPGRHAVSKHCFPSSSVRLQTCRWVLDHGSIDAHQSRRVPTSRAARRRGFEVSDDHRRSHQPHDAGREDISTFQHQCWHQAPECQRLQLVVRLFLHPAERMFRFKRLHSNVLHIMRPSHPPTLARLCVRCSDWSHRVVSRLMLSRLSLAASFASIEASRIAATLFSRSRTVLNWNGIAPTINAAATPRNTPFLLATLVAIDMLLHDCRCRSEWTP